VRIDVITIFPDYLVPLQLSLIGRARADGLLDVRVHDLRDWTADRHRTVDDTPYGGGPGMLMRPEPWGEALDAVAPPGGPQPRLVVPSPSGLPLTQSLAQDLAGQQWLVFACGRYEGIDHRVLDDAEGRMSVTEVSVGDVVLAGGEAVALVVIEAVTRLIPGVIGNAGSLVDESHAAAGLLEAPAYTKPPSWRGHDVPPVLLSGNHQQIERWRRDEALRRTARRRPDLVERLSARDLSRRDLEVLAEAGWVPVASSSVGVASERLQRRSAPVAD
jgi:tRNA (guanine37-N1)-methyltransferase